jgi:Fe2+ transport system protein FeoA
MPTSIRLLDAPSLQPLVLDHSRVTPAMRRRLSTLGLRSGTDFTILQKTSSGGRIALVGESRIALGKDICRQLLVEVKL